MRRIPKALLAGITVIPLLVAACSAGTQPSTSPTGTSLSIVGTWKCAPPEAASQDVVEIRADGTVMITQPGASPGSMTWSVEGNRGAFITPEGRDEFTIEVGRLVFDDGFVCIPAS